MAFNMRFPKLDNCSAQFLSFATFFQSEEEQDKNDLKAVNICCENDRGNVPEKEVCLYKLTFNFLPCDLYSSHGCPTELNSGHLGGH
jgi:hypothetical protein